MEKWQRAGVALAVGTALAGVFYYGTLLMQRQLYGSRKKRVRRVALKDLQWNPQVVVPDLKAWVGLCGTVFNVSDDPFFDLHEGVYGAWNGHDVTFLLLKMGVSPDSADDAKMTSYFDKELAIERVDEEGDEESHRRYKLLEEWYTRFHSRYPAMAEINDLFAGKKWSKLREKLVPSQAALGHGHGRSGGKCPLGFGSRVVDPVISRAATSKNVPTITFQGKRYDVSNSSLFGPGGDFVHFVGHDVTYALATRSNRSEDLDVQPQREYTYEEQVLLENYRIAFARELALIAEPSIKSEPEYITKFDDNQFDLHDLVERGDIDSLNEYLSKHKENIDIDQICIRTTMTPLHKAVEKNRLDLVRVLVDAGANPRAEASLYDDEIPLELAKRFQYTDIVAYLTPYTISGTTVP